MFNTWSEVYACNNYASAEAGRPLFVLSCSPLQVWMVGMTVFMMVALPKMMENMDPEQLKEMQVRWLVATTAHD